MSRRITFLGVVRFTDRVLVAGYSPSEADDSLIIKEVWGITLVVPGVLPSQQQIQQTSVEFLRTKNKTPSIGRPAQGTRLLGLV